MISEQSIIWIPRNIAKFSFNNYLLPFVDERITKQLSLRSDDLSGDMFTVESTSINQNHFNLNQFIRHIDKFKNITNRKSSDNKYKHKINLGRRS